MSIIETGVNMLEGLGAVREKMAQMIVEKRDPTPEEWATLRSRTQSLSDKIQAAGSDPEPESEVAGHDGKPDGSTTESDPE